MTSKIIVQFVCKLIIPIMYVFFPDCSCDHIRISSTQREPVTWLVKRSVHAKITMSCTMHGCTVNCHLTLTSINAEFFYILDEQVLVLERTAPPCIMLGWPLMTAWLWHLMLARGVHGSAITSSVLNWCDVVGTRFYAWSVTLWETLQQLERSQPL